MMPDLPQINGPSGQPPSELRPNPVGVEATAQAGYRIGRFFDQAGADIGRGVTAAGTDFQRHVASQDITRAAPVFAETVAQLDDAWNTATQQPGFDPTDPTVRQKFMQEHVAPALMRLQDGMSTPESRQWLVGQTFQAIEHFNTKTIADMSTLAGSKAVQNLDQTSMTLQGRVYGDFTTLDNSIGTLDATTEAMRDLHGVSSEHMAEIDNYGRTQRGALVYQAYRGAISRAPTPEAVDQITGQLGGDQLHTQYLDGKQTDELETYAKEQKRAIQYDAREAQADQTRQNKMEFDQRATALVASGYQPDGSWQAPRDYYRSLQALSQMPGADLGQVDAMMNRGEAGLRASIEHTYQQSDPRVYNGDLKRLALPPTDPRALSKTQIEQQVAHGWINDHDARVFRDSVDSAHSDPGEAQAHEQLNKVTDSFKSTFTKSNPLASVVDFAGDQAYGRFQQAVYERYLDLRTNGHLTPAAAEAALTNPSDPNYVGGMVARLRPTMADSTRDLNLWAGQQGQHNPLVP